MVARHVAGIRSDGSGSLRGKATGQSTLAGVLTPGAVLGEKRETMENEAPSYTCPRCHRGCMKSTGSDGDWYQMECPDCGHQEEKEAS
jgi:DNA-directed RNA polymerase subunit RPC12/RpoP